MWIGVSDANFSPLSPISEAERQVDPASSQMRSQHDNPMRIACLIGLPMPIEHLRDKFGTGSLLDEAGVEALAKEGGWCVLSGDRRIATKRSSRELLLRSNLIGFFPLPAIMALPVNGIAAHVLTLWPVLETTGRTMGRGCFELGIKRTRLRPIG